MYNYCTDYNKTIEFKNSNNIHSIDQLFDNSKEYLKTSEIDRAMTKEEIALYPFPNHIDTWFSIVAVIKQLQRISGLSFDQIDDTLELKSGSSKKLSQAQDVLTISIPYIRLVAFINIAREAKEAGQPLSWWTRRKEDTMSQSPLDIIKCITPKNYLDKTDYLLDTYSDDLKEVPSYLVCENTRWFESEKFVFTRENPFV